MSKRVVVASGYFNPLHYGHVTFLQKAKEIGSSLIVVVNNDRQAALALGQESSFTHHGMPARDRVRLVRSLACVDAAVEAVDSDLSVCNTLRLLHPDVFANGGNQIASEEETAVCKELGIEIVEGLGIEMLQLKPFTQHYDWGKPQRSSCVAALAGETKLQFPVSPSGGGKPYAELWMGDHPSGMNGVKTPKGDESLRVTLIKAPSVLGPKLAGGGQLPFLLKVLSIQKALSIQAHPDRELAKRLHQERPDVYKDANHKPEIAIALTDFEALCGFRPVSELVGLLNAVPELSSMIGGEAAEMLSNANGDPRAESIALKQAYSSMMHRSDDVARDHVEALIKRAAAAVSADPLERAETLQPPLCPDGPLPRTRTQTAPHAMPSDLAELAIRLHGQFGNDIGIFSIFFMNYVRMHAGECLYMAQNVPHAYLSGDIVECMACSDNVVRGGLTPKYKDVEILCEMLRYEGGKPPCIKPVEVGPGSLLYEDPDIREFQVTHITFSPGRRSRLCFSCQGPSLAFAWSGEGSVTVSGETKALTSGVVFLLGAGVDADFHADTELDVFVACCPPRYFS
mmetsp:Transcript_67647/g.188764  ORF Transcript_67647/g.188764 Transcript_67647/m.188764 type:complete len:570 (+) Transcript_67647:77-1786(+)